MKGSRFDVELESNVECCVDIMTENHVHWMLNYIISALEFETSFAHRYVIGFSAVISSVHLTDTISLQIIFIGVKQ